MEVLYLDALFVFNLLADYLLCLSAGRICGLVLRRKRYLAAAFFGAAYGAAVYLPGLFALAAPPVRLAAGLLMGLIAFGRERRPLRCTGVLLSVSALFGGALWAVSLAAGSSGGPVPLSTRLLLLSFALCYALLRLLFRFRRQPMERQLIPVRVVLDGRESRFTALRDTGNALLDPVGGQPVLVACPHALAPLFGPWAALLELPGVELLELSGQIPALSKRFRLLPFRALGGGGLLPVFRPDALELDGRPRPEVLIAVSPQAAGDGFEALV